MTVDKKTTVRHAVITVWQSMPREFSALAFNAAVRDMTGRPQLMDTSISATMRRCRADGSINFECIDYRRAIYEKISGNQTTLKFNKY